MPPDEEVEKAAQELFERYEGDARVIARVAAQFQLEARRRTGGAIEVFGAVGMHGQPFVQFNWGGEVGQITVEQARQHALLILEASQNAVTDAALAGFAKDELKLDMPGVAGIIDGMRLYRSDRWGQPDLAIEFSKPPAEEGP